MEEVVADFAAAHLTRREAMHGSRQTPWGSARSVHWRCWPRAAVPSHGAKLAAPSRGGASTTVPGATPPPAAMVIFDGPNGELQGAWAPAGRSKGSVLVIHEHRGLTDHIRTIRRASPRRRLAGRPLLRGRRDRPSVGTPRRRWRSPRGADDRRPARGWTGSRRDRGQKLAVIGFCFGGGHDVELPRSGRTAPRRPRLLSTPQAPADPDFRVPPPRSSRSTASSTPG